jgi:GR25 family glycosyltransferase involved in LPS biosynthesis
VIGSLQRLFEAVDKIVVVTVASATARHTGVSELMSRLKLPFEFRFGRDCRNAAISELISQGDYDPAERLRLGRPPMTPAEIGCALSHREVAREIADGPDRRVLILEDDVRLVPENLRHFQQSIVAMPHDWNLAYFGYAAMNLSTPLMMRIKLISYYPLLHMLGSSKHDPGTIRRIFQRPLNAYWMYAGWFNNAHAYAIDRRAAQYIADAQASVTFEADLILNHLVRFSGLNAICLKHPIFDQRLDIPSLIGDRPSWQASP